MEPLYEEGTRSQCVKALRIASSSSSLSYDGIRIHNENWGFSVLGFLLSSVSALCFLRERPRNWTIPFNYQTWGAKVPASVLALCAVASFGSGAPSWPITWKLIRPPIPNPSSPEIESFG